MKFGLIGEKLSHSYSKVIHEEVFKENNINASYDLIETKEEGLKDLIENLRKGEYQGFNVTIPYKEKIMQYLDQIDEDADQIKAVNTIYIKDGIVHGTNTDYLGFIESIHHHSINLKSKKCMVLGTGGASKAICYSLDLLKARYQKVSRTKKEGIIDYDDLKNESYDVIINTTPVGMYPNIDKAPISKEEALKANMIIDLIFNPRITKLMSYNENSFNGLMMLIYQALYADIIWLGEDIKYDIDKIKGVINNV